MSYVARLVWLLEQVQFRALKETLYELRIPSDAFT